MARTTKLAAAALAAVLATAAPAMAQPPGGPPGPANAKVAAPVDLTGQWVAVVIEDWRWRMVTPPKGDFTSVPLNRAGQAAGAAWDLAADNAAGRQCAAYGVAALLRQPLRLRISWQDDNTLKMETDAGQQTRLLKFITPAPGALLPALSVAGPAPAQRNWQGESKAQWFRNPQSFGALVGLAPPVIGPGGALRVVTRNMRAGYLRKNGAPYSENAIVTEHFIRHDDEDGTSWFTVTTIVDDPQYLREPFVTSTSFKKETDPSKWAPGPCNTPAPLEQPRAPGRPGG